MDKNYKAIIFFLFAIMLINLKFFLFKPNVCKKNCQYISNEIDLINCLDSCAVNSNEFIDNSFPKNKFFLLLTIIISSFMLIIWFINKIVLEDNLNLNIICQFFPDKYLQEKLLYKDNDIKINYNMLNNKKD